MNRQELREYYKKQFVKKSKEKYPDRFLYDDMYYVNSDTEVTLLCKKHGEFKTKPHNHLSKGAGCKPCARESYRRSRAKSLKEHLDAFHKKHGDYYEYVNLQECMNKDYDLQIICPEHGEFQQKLFSHREGKGCRDCGYRKAGGDGSYNYTNISRLENIPDIHVYIVRLRSADEDFYKIGLTKHKDNRRFTQIKKKYSCDFVYRKKFKLDEGYEFEQFVLENCCRYKTKRHFNGHKECFTSQNIEYFLEVCENESNQ